MANVDAFIQPVHSPFNRKRSFSFSNSNVSNRSVEFKSISTSILRCKAIGDVRHVSEVPSWMEKRHIRGGYRPDGMNFVEIARSMFGIHNETVNVWSHFLSAVWFVLSAVRISHWDVMAKLSAMNRILMIMYPLAAATTFLVSTVYHLFQCRSERVYQTLRNVDFQSIQLLITASYLPALSLAYAGIPHLRTIYLGVTFAVFPLSSLAVLVSYMMGLGSVKNLVLLLSAFWGIIPTLHTQWASVPASSFFIQSTFTMWGLYAAGFLFYGLKLPERWRAKGSTGTLDLLGNSHQFWHLFTILAAYSWFRFLLRYTVIVTGSM